MREVISQDVHGAFGLAKLLACWVRTPLSASAIPDRLRRCASAPSTASLVPHILRSPVDCFYKSSRPSQRQMSLFAWPAPSHPHRCEGYFVAFCIMHVAHHAVYQRRLTVPHQDLCLVCLRNSRPGYRLGSAECTHTIEACFGCEHYSTGVLVVDIINWKAGQVRGCLRSSRR
ncbi:hypothetical protein B0H11DRAFT_2193424 [Mycena galericulata]|nr:hypothetical protein B0H11DRAFT_2193424 [Mycena galericulata]